MVNCLRPHGRSGLKYNDQEKQCKNRMSPPTRAEWIEIGWQRALYGSARVSAHTGGVD